MYLTLNFLRVEDPSRALCRLLEEQTKTLLKRLEPQQFGPNLPKDKKIDVIRFIGFLVRQNSLLRKRYILEAIFFIYFAIL